MKKKKKQVIYSLFISSFIFCCCHTEQVWAAAALKGLFLSPLARSHRSLLCVCRSVAATRKFMTRWTIYLHFVPCLVHSAYAAVEVVVVSWLVVWLVDGVNTQEAPHVVNCFLSLFTRSPLFLCVGRDCTPYPSSFSAYAIMALNE